MIKAWYKCYHSVKYPITTFVHVDDELDVPEPGRLSSLQEPNANSTLIEPSEHTPTNMTSQRTNNTSNKSLPTHSTRFTPNSPVHTESQSGEYSYSVGHISHIPRIPPSPATYTIPSFINKCIGTEHDSEEDIFGMIKLKENDVCYTNGTIEWVGRKRSFPINSGFKILNEIDRPSNEPRLKKSKRFDKSFTNGLNKIKECECADVLPTVNAIVDHLNALHEAVDLVDLRLGTLEDVMSKN